MHFHAYVFPTCVPEPLCVPLYISYIYIPNVCTYACIYPVWIQHDPILHIVRPSAKVGCVVVGENYTWLENTIWNMVTPCEEVPKLVRVLKVLSHIWMSHVPCMNESCPMYEWVMSHRKSNTNHGTSIRVSCAVVGVHTVAVDRRHPPTHVHIHIHIQTQTHTDTQYRHKHTLTHTVTVTVTHTHIHTNTHTHIRKHI